MSSSHRIHSRTAAALLALVPQGDTSPFRALTFEAACAAAEAEKKVVLVDFFTTWCPPCKKLDAVTWKDPAVVEWLTESTVPLKLDAEEHVELAERYEVDAYPSIVLLRPDGTELGRIVGYRPPEPFLTEAKGVLSGVRPSDRIKAQLEARGWNVTMLRQEYADELARERRYPEALEHYLWCFDHGTEHTIGYEGVRVSFLLSDIAELGAKHPPALDALRQRRDTAKATLLAGKASVLEAAAFAGINRCIEDGRMTLEVYDAMAAVEPQVVDGRRTNARPALFRDVFPLLIDDRRYADAVAGLGDPVKHYEHLLALDELTSMHDESLEEDMQEMLVESRRERFVGQTALVFEALAGARHDGPAAEVRRRILEYDASPATRATLAKHARRAEREDLAAELEAPPK